MPIYDANCTAGHKFEKLLPMDKRHNVLICPECGEDAHIIISPVRSALDGTDPSLPGAYLSWERKRSKNR